MSKAEDLAEELTMYVKKFAAADKELGRLEERVRQLEEALTPSAYTKTSYAGEFTFRSPGGRVEYVVPWTTIKEIVAAIRAHADLLGKP